MQLVYADRVKETSTTTGTGAYTLAGAVSAFQSFAAIGNSYSCAYVAEEGANWEVGIGTYTAAGTLLSRDQIIASSNANAAVNWGVGTRTIFCTVPARQLQAFAHDPSATNGITGAADTPSLLNGGLLAAGAQSVANGDWAVAVGGYARAVGANACAFGSSPYANADYAVSVGFNTVTGIGAVAIGGTNSSINKPQATGNYSANIGANGGTASGDYSAVLGGNASNAGGVSAAAVGGENNNAYTNCSTVSGRYARTHFYGASALGGGDAAGLAQAERGVQRKTTTDATTTALEFDANAATNGYLTLPANFAAAVVVHVVGRETATGDSIAFRLEGLMHTNGSGVPSLVGTTPSAVDLGHSAGAATWTAALAVDAVTHNCLLVNVTGEAAKTIKWVARIELVEVGA